ncbi:MAG: penicillin acylase family protein [Ardenticatenaceae bacterium]
MRVLFRIFVVVILLVVVGLVGGYVYLGDSLPMTSGTVRLSGLDGPVEIVRDGNGVPHIFATTDHDAFFGQGYVHAQDRMWQLDFQRRVGAGRLSEVLGDSTLETDKFLRTLGTYRAAEAAWSALSRDAQEMLQAYAAGVNAWIDERHPLPPEYLILGVEPEPWIVYDSLVWSKMMAWDLGGNYDVELLRVRLAQAIGAERAAELMPGYPEDGTTILASHQIQAATADTLLALDRDLQANLQLGGLDVGSNNWVIAGSRTESGDPLLANDPHLGARIPSIWYLIELKGDTLHVTGASLPGVPLVPTGHNEDIAWGVTNFNPDVQDLYMERINPENPNQYEVDEEWVDMTIVEEAIYVKGQEEPILWAARSTRHGPLISDVTSRAPMAVALRWTALEPGDTTLQSFMKVNYATNWDQFTEAMKDYVAPSQNFVYADQEGNIGYFGPGHIPIRAKGDGTIPVPGWDSKYKWRGWIPFEELPQAYNPEAGFIATANNRVVSDDYPYFLSSDWAPPYRAERIVELIEEMSSNGQKISLEDMIRIQADQRSAQARELLPLLLELEPTDQRQTEALEYLQAWDGESSADSISTTIYQAWFMHLGRTVFEDDLKGDLYDRFANRRHETFLINIMREANNPWCDNVLTTDSESCANIAEEALDRALDDLTERLGDDMQAWQWGELHRTQYPHSPFSEVDMLKPFFHREIANGGDGYTVNVAPLRYSDAYLQYHVPSYRHIADPSNWNNSLFMHTTGQSGHLLSDHYDDLIERHQAVEYLPMTFGRENVTGDVLVLQPE